MVELRVEKTYSKEFDGKNGKWTKFSIKSGDKWYTLKGKNVGSIKENEIVRGEIEERQYTGKDGKPGTEYTIVLIDSMIADLIKRVEKLELALKEKTRSAGRKEPDEPEIETDDNSDLPF